MSIEHDYAAEHVARIRHLFDEAKRANVETAAPTDRPIIRRQLIAQLDQMLGELEPTGRSAPATTAQRFRNRQE